MDLAYSRSDKKGCVEELNNNISDDPSMEEIVFSMRSSLSLLGTSSSGSTDGPGNVKNPPLCSSPIDTGLINNSLTMDSDPNQSFEDVFDDTLTLDDIALPGGESRGGNRERVSGCQGSQHPSDGQFTSSDLPLCNGYHNGEVEDEELDVSTREHPRLQSTFYQRLRDKYPKAFLRRSSVSSDTTSVCSDGGQNKPSSMTPMPKGHHQSRGSNSFNSEGDPNKNTSPTTKHGPGGGRGLPPRHPSAMGSTRRDKDNNPNLGDKPGTNMSSIDDVTRHLGHDLTITGTTRRSKSPLRHKPEPRMTMNDRNMAGILKKDLEMLNSSMTSQSSYASYQDSDSSQLSLKQRLQKNQMSLRALLSEENNPLKKSKPWRSRKALTMNKSFGSDITLDNELSISIDNTDGTCTKTTNSRDGLLLMPKPPTQAETSSFAIDSLVEQKRSLVDQPRKKHLGTKRYVSPDSSHDSAVDMDTASLQSSPGSSDTQTTVNTCRPSAVRSNGKRTNSSSSGGGRASQCGSSINAGNELSPRDSHRSSVPNPDYQLAHGSSHSKGDSDVDSGIAQGAYSSHRSRERKDSSSSMENDQELESIMSFSRVQGGPRYTAISSQDFRASSRQKNPYLGNTGKSGPLKADHSIQPSSPRHGNRTDDDNQDPTLGEQYRGSSSTDHNQKRGSPLSRVRFEDEMSDIAAHQESLSISQQQRATSNPDLRMTQDSPRHDDIPSGCSRRAPKLRGARRSSPSPGPSTVMYEKVEKQHSLPSAPTQGLPPSGRSQDIRAKMHKLRSHNKTPTEMIYAAAKDESFSEDQDISVHRASPVVIASPGRSGEGHSYLSGPWANENDLNNEVASLNGFNDAWTYALSAKSSKKPWKKNRGKYNPSESVENIQKELHRTQVKTILSRPASSQGDPYSIDKFSKKSGKNQIVTRPASCTAEIHTPSERLQNRVENLYEEVRDQSFVSSTSEAARLENPYEEVQVGPADKKADDVYAVPERRSRSRTRSSQNPGVVTDLDDTIDQEEAPPIPQRGYTSDLERYKDLSGSRTSLSGKMDSFRKAAKSSWSALRRAVSLERVDQPVSNEGPEFKMKKSPSLQSLVKKFSFKKKDRAKQEGSQSELPPKPTHSRPTRPSSAPLSRNKRNSSSLTSLNIVDSPQNFRPIGKLKQLNPDGTQIIEMVRPPKGPFGFYIARGNVKYGGGVFVSRLSDGLPDHFFAGLLGIGDEILEINCQLITNLTLDEVYKMMSERHHLLLKTLPYVARKDT